MFHTKGPILKVFRIIPDCYYCCSWGYPRSVALVLGVSKLLAMAKDIGGFRPIAVGKVFVYLLIAPLSYSFRGRLRSTYPSISLEC
jgi:hypothetical protein